MPVLTCKSAGHAFCPVSDPSKSVVLRQFVGKLFVATVTATVMTILFVDGSFEKLYFTARRETLASRRYLLRARNGKRADPEIHTNLDCQKNGAGKHWHVSSLAMS